MIELRPMTEAEFLTYTVRAIANYTAEIVKGEGRSQEQAQKIANESYSQILNKGLNSEDQFLFTIREKETSRNIGMIWFGKKASGKPHAFIYDFILEPECRGKGYGKLAMQLIEGEVKKQGFSAIGLHVFGHNTVAINLYEKVGFRTTNRMMMKDL